MVRAGSTWKSLFWLREVDWGQRQSEQCGHTMKGSEQIRQFWLKPYFPHYPESESSPKWGRYTCKESSTLHWYHLLCQYSLLGIKSSVKKWHIFKWQIHNPSTTKLNTVYFHLLLSLEKEAHTRWWSWFYT